ncbi:MAG: TM0996/MTH895 family glutaredoxin-like protein [gamma proteobacterium symbiont of Taylorina sp.]|nr:TM0996/MTH895 family glutaredoxin-like protein [gamma proteobacterium symbiont of Taylorina sp.]
MIEVKVLGPGCKNCQTTHKLIVDVTNENGIEITLEKVEDMAEIMSYGIMSTPGVIVDGKIAHAGSIPDKKTILSWFKSSCCPADDNCC